MSQLIKIPAKGRNHEELLAYMQAMRQNDAQWQQGRVFSLVYYAGDAHHELLKQASDLFFVENALNPMAFKSLKTMEAEVIRMTASMLHGDQNAVGTMTSGGTESILMAVKAYRDRARQKWPWIRSPEIVAPRSIHVGFDKAAHYFGVTLRYAPLDSDFRANVREMERLVNRNTILLAASAPQYPQGIIDPIEEIGTLAMQRRIPFHVDACVGGFMLPWIERLGYPVPCFDFRVPGVTSISADLHKYGYSAKGASTVVYRSMDYLKHQFFISTDWSGGVYASPSMLGTRAGGPIAAAWAALQGLGEEGYLELAQAAMAATQRLKEGIRQIPELRLLGNPNMTVLAYSSNHAAVDIYAIADVLESHGWMVDRQQDPPSIHCTVTGHHRGFLEHYLEHLNGAVAIVKINPRARSQGNAAMYGLVSRMPFRGLVKYSVQKIMEDLYGPSSHDPQEAPSTSAMLPEWLSRMTDPLLDGLDRIRRVRQKATGRGR